MKSKLGIVLSTLTPFLIGIFFHSPAIAVNGDYKSVFDCENKDRFNWYCKEIAKKKEERPTQPPAPDAKTDPRDPIANAPELKEHQAIKERLENLLKIAYVNPTPENIKNYISFQNMVSDKASVFADMTKRVLWANPELDYSQRFPVAKMAKDTQKSNLAKEQEALYKKLNSEGYGLFFFYRSDCPYCHKMANPLKMFLDKSQMDIVSVSLDGVLLNDIFPNSTVNKGQAEALGVERTPTIILVNTKTKDMTRIASGWVSTYELQERIFRLMAKKPGESH